MTLQLRPLLICFQPVFPALTAAHTLFSLEYVMHFQFHALVHGVPSTCYGCSSFVKNLYIFWAHVICDFLLKYFLYSAFWVKLTSIPYVLFYSIKIKWQKCLSPSLYYTQRKKVVFISVHLCLTQCLTNRGYSINTELNKSIPDLCNKQEEQTLRIILMHKTY